MKRLISLLLFLFVIIPAHAQDCHVSGKLDDILQNFNTIAELYSYIEDVPYGQIDPDKCGFEKLDNGQGLYMCNIDASTGLYIGTDNKKNAVQFQIHGLTKNKVPSKSTYNWAFVATCAACLNLDARTINDIFLEAFSEGYYNSKGIRIMVGPHPSADNLWVYAIANRQN